MRDDAELTALLSDAPTDELWLISYADLLTLLIGFFAVLVAASGVKAARFEQIAASLSGAAPAPLSELKTKVDALVRAARLADKVVAREDAQGLGIELKDALLFDSGSADIRPEGARVIREVAALVAGLPDRPVIIEGHTDDVPIGNARFRSNWELAAQRAVNVLHALERSGIDARRLSARSLADTQAVRGLANVELQRAASRRVVLRVE